VDDFSLQKIIRKIAGETPAIQDCGHFACVISGSQAFRLCFFRFAGETPASPDRGRPTCDPSEKSV
jgi:hypothetical protein